MNYHLVMKTFFNKIAIVGPGLIGGSMGMAIRRKKLASRVVGVGRREVSLRKAALAGAADTTTTDLRAGVTDADLVVLATPPDTFGKIAAVLAGCMKKNAILTDVASTKEKVVKSVLGSMSGREDIIFIPTHPMAGSEKGGVENASHDLFAGSKCIFTPLQNTPTAALELLKRMWEELGAHILVITPQEHDTLVARVSHVPHIVASALINTVGESDGQAGGKGLLDTTRIASGNPELWTAICENNPEKILSALDDFSDTIAEARELIARKDFKALAAWLHAAKKKRDFILERRTKRGV